MAVALPVLLANTAVLLGTKSASRRAILTEMGLNFQVIAADIDEKAIRRETPEELVSALAEAKATAILSRLSAPSSLPANHPASPPATAPPFSSSAASGGSQRAALPGRRLLITADQVVTFRGVVREKPETPSEAAAFLRSYSGRSARTVGALRVTDVRSGRHVSAIDVAEIFFRHPIPEGTIEAMVREGTVLSCAGGLMAESPLLAPYVERLDGSLDSIMGMGKALAERLLREACALADEAEAEEAAAGAAASFYK